MKNLRCLCIVVLFSHLLTPASAKAEWYWGIGHRNPPGSTLGVNFMHLWSNWAFEVGIGQIESSEDDEDTERDESQLSVGGDLNMKYLFSSGGVRPYLQAGVGSGVSAGGSGVGAGASLAEPFAGAGLFLFASGFHIYVSYLFVNAKGLQVGVGF